MTIFLHAQRTKRTNIHKNEKGDESMWYAPQTHWPMAQQWWMPYHPYAPYHYGMPSIYSPHPTPYPKPMMPPMKQTGMLPQKQAGMLPQKQAGILSQFKTSDGTYDITKMMNTMGQMMNMANQVGGMMKGLTQTFKV
jgi:hypothetical protein